MRKNQSFLSLDNLDFDEDEEEDQDDESPHHDGDSSFDEKDDLDEESVKSDDEKELKIKSGKKPKGNLTEREPSPSKVDAYTKNLKT